MTVHKKNIKESKGNPPRISPALGKYPYQLMQTNTPALGMFSHRVILEGGVYKYQVYFKHDDLKETIYAIFFNESDAIEYEVDMNHKLPDYRKRAGLE